MGSWNGTCGLTHLPIFCGDDVALLFLTNGNEEKNDSGALYSNDFWTPCFLPLYGKYDDYGLIGGFSENDWHTRHIIETVKSVLIEKEVGENEYHDLAVKKDGLTMEGLLELIRESRVELSLDPIMKQCGFRDNRLGFMMVHRNIYDHFTHSLETLLDINVTFNDAVKRGREAYETVMNLDETSLTGHLFKRSGILKLDPEDKTSWRIYNPVRKLLEMDHGEPRLSAIYSTISFRRYKEVLLTKMDEKAPADDLIVDFIIREYCKLDMFDHKMNILRRLYTPQMSSGQEDNYSHHVELCEVIKRHIEERERLQEEMWGSDDDE